MRLFAVACVGLGLVSAATSAAQVRQDDWIIVNTGGMKVSASNTLELRDGIIITNRQETMMIRAKEADAQGVELSFNNSQWEFRGDVHIEVDGAVLDAATATVRFTSNRLGNARVVGSPATVFACAERLDPAQPGACRNDRLRCGQVTAAPGWRRVVFGRPQ